MLPLQTLARGGQSLGANGHDGTATVGAAVAADVASTAAAAPAAATAVADFVQ